jgi:hypothetical protein
VALDPDAAGPQYLLEIVGAAAGVVRLEEIQHACAGLTSEELITPADGPRRCCSSDEQTRSRDATEDG